MANRVSMKALLETGVHFGHQARKWNPKMEPYIFTKRNGIHIIDLRQTVEFLDEVYDIVRDTVARGGTVMFVGTKRQAQDTIEREAIRSGMPFVTTRWLGGTLTNWKTIKQRLDTLKRMEKDSDEGRFDKLTKKERLMIEREIERLNLRMGGLKVMKRLPDLLFVVDARREYTAVKEANTLGVPIIAITDTNADPDEIDYIIPGNDDAIRAIKLITEMVAQAVLEGQAMRKAYNEDEEATDFEEFMSDQLEEEDDEAYLGEATLAKLRAGGLSFAGGRPSDDDEDFDDEEYEDDFEDDED
ncbi:MAG: 30S ribosomal protein S2 [Chloroflexi bacterium]|nr:30S ribosomal protein S2 [Chloroflexota bacterium]